MFIQTPMVFAGGCLVMFAPLLAGQNVPSTFNLSVCMTPQLTSLTTWVRSEAQKVAWLDQVDEIYFRDHKTEVNAMASGVAWKASASWSDFDTTRKEYHSQHSGILERSESASYLFQGLDRDAKDIVMKCIELNERTLLTGFWEYHTIDNASRVSFHLIFRPPANVGAITVDLRNLDNVQGPKTLRVTIKGNKEEVVVLKRTSTTLPMIGVIDPLYSPARTFSVPAQPSEMRTEARFKKDGICLKRDAETGLCYQCEFTAGEQFTKDNSDYPLAIHTETPKRICTNMPRNTPFRSEAKGNVHINGYQKPRQWWIGLVLDTSGCTRYDHQFTGAEELYPITMQHVNGACIVPNTGDVMVSLHSYWSGAGFDGARSTGSIGQEPLFLDKNFGFTITVDRSPESAAQVRRGVASKAKSR